MKPSEKELLDAGINIKEIKRVHAFVDDDEKAIDIERKRITFVVSSEIIDHSDEIVEAQAVYDGILRPGEFIANPICLACHMHRLESGMPSAIGSWDTATVTMTGREGKRRVKMVDQFDTELKLGSEYWIAYKNKTMRAVSIAFRVLDYRVEDRDGKRVLIITKLRMLEISCVAVGCNQEALSELGWMDEKNTGDKSLVETLQKTFDGKLALLRDQIMAKLEDIEALHIPGSNDDLSLSPDEKEVPDETEAQEGQSALHTIHKALLKMES